MQTRIDRILIANRGEIAMRIIRSCREMGIESVAVFSDPDADMPHTRAADAAVSIGGSAPGESYLKIDAIVAACRESGADAVHPGYGFLAENADFARRLAAEGIVFIGPEPDTIERMGDKIAARKLMEEHNVPVVPGYHGEDQSVDRLKSEADRIGYPVMVKASAGGGGRGMRVVEDSGAFQESYDSARREAQNAFGDDRVFLEKFIARPRHIEIQVFGDRHGNQTHLFERECSIQRRHQKIIEESPSPALTDESREKMARAAVQAAHAVDYVGAGTVEFIYSDVDQSFYFLEMNTRLQVEHPVTELVTGVDLVREQIRVAQGEPLSFSPETLVRKGHAIEVRLYAEDPARDFMPSTGKVERFEVPETVRVDSGVESGSEISIYYDPMVAKIIAFDETSRSAAIEKMIRALNETILFGPENNIDLLRQILAHPEFEKGNTTTHFIAQHFGRYRGPVLSPEEIEVARVAAGLLFYHGAKNNRPAERLASEAGQSPWYDLAGFRLWD